MFMQKFPRFLFSTKGKVPLSVPHPTMAESFQTKFSEAQVEKLMNPKGFLKPEEESNYTEEQTSTQEQNVSDKSNPDDIKECGFKVKGPEPTRFGDWEKGRRCIDF